MARKDKEYDDVRVDDEVAQVTRDGMMRGKILELGRGLARVRWDGGVVSNPPVEKLWVVHRASR